MLQLNVEPDCYVSDLSAWSIEFDGSMFEGLWLVYFSLYTTVAYQQK